MKQFSCVLSDPCFKKSINVDTNECRTVQDLMPRISSLLQIDENQFTVSNANPDNVLSLLDNNFEFQLEFNNHCPDFTINFPDEFVQKVTNGSNMNFHDIIRCIQNERSIYYSPSCINNINIMVWGIPLPKTGNHLSRMPNNVKISFQLDVNTVSIIFDQKAFIFPENEPFERGKNFIENVLGQNVEVSIQNITNNQSLHNGDLLQTNKLYEINARENFTFNSIDEYYYFDQKMDYFSTVFDAKQMLAHINYNACQNILPENILIFCRGSDEIIDPYYRLDNIQKLGGIYFRISLKIYFKFDVTNAVRYDDFISELKPNTQICDIAANFSKFFGINQKLLFLNNRKEEVPYTKSLNEIDHMKTIENGKKKNILYIKIINNGPNTNVHNPGTTEACTTGTTATSTACATEATCTTRTTVTEATSTTETTETTSTTGTTEATSTTGTTEATSTTETTEATSTTETTEATSTTETTEATSTTGTTETTSTTETTETTSTTGTTEATSTTETTEATSTTGTTEATSTTGTTEATSTTGTTEATSTTGTTEATSTTETTEATSTTETTEATSTTETTEATSTTGTTETTSTTGTTEATSTTGTTETTSTTGTTETTSTTGTTEATSTTGTTEATSTTETTEATSTTETTEATSTTETTEATSTTETTEATSTTETTEATSTTGTTETTSTTETTEATSTTGTTEATSTTETTEATSTTETTEATSTTETTEATSTTETTEATSTTETTEATSTTETTEATSTTETTEATSTTETTETTSTTGAAEPRVIHESQCDESADANSTHRGYLGEYLLEKLMPQLKRRNLLGSGASSKVYRVRFIDEFNNYDENARDTYYSLKVYNREYFLKSKESPATCSINDNDNDTEEEEELIEIDFEKVQKFILEYEIILSLSHPNIIKAFGINPGSEKYSPCILFEYVPYSLDKLIPIKENSPIKLQKIHLVGIIYEICKAMDCIHKKNIIHRDIKPSNILITSECHPKICDFGISTFCSSDSVSQTSGIGTIKFMAPEILNQDKHYTENVDVYSFGVLVHYILSNGEFPKIIGNEVTVSKNINDVSKELITRCLSFNPEQRPSFAEIIELINESQLLLIDGIEDDILLLYEFLGFF